MADKNTYYILLQPKLDKSSITEMESKFKQASKRIGANLGSALKSSVKGAATSMVAQLSIANILGNSLSNLMSLPNKAKSLAMEMRQLAIQTKNVATLGDLGSANFAGFYQGLQSAGFEGDFNDLKEVFAETAKQKAKGGAFEGSKMETGELVAQILQSWQNVGKKYGFNSKEFQDAKKEVEVLLAGTDSVRKFESLVKSGKSIKEMSKQGNKELGITDTKRSSKIYDENLKALQGLSTQSQETKMQKFLFTKKIDPKSIQEIKNIQDSDFNMALSGMSDSQLLKNQITISNSIQKTQENIDKTLTRILNYIIKFIDGESSVNQKGKTKEIIKETAKNLNQTNTPTPLPTVDLSKGNKNMFKDFLDKVIELAKRDLDV
jgi:hypothetical protein